MDELEHRIAALETWAIEVGAQLAQLDPLILSDAKASILATIDNGTTEEKAIRLGAVGLIEDAQNRFKGPQIGSAILRPPEG